MAKDAQKKPGPARRLIVYTLAMVVLPLCAHAVYHVRKGGPSSYWEADWSSTGLLPKAADHPAAMVRVYAARTGRWRGIFAVHTWIVIKDRNGQSYQRFDKVGWGTPIRVNAYPPDGRWYSNLFTTVFAADGAKAEKLIPSIRAAVRNYRFGKHGDYRLWPGPNSNTFTSCVISAVPEIDVVLPPTAIGKDHPCDGRMLAFRSTEGGFRTSLGGYLSVSAGKTEGFELSIFGAVIGLDFRRPALKLPGFGRIGMSARQQRDANG